MASYRLKRTMRGGALTATAVAAVVGVSSTPAVAAPDEASATQQQLRDLGRKAEELTEALKKAEDDHNAKKAELDRSTAEAARAQQVATQAHAEEEKFRVDVDRFTRASYQGARLNKLSTLLVSESPNDFLDRASALDALAKDNNDVIKRLSAATHQAEAATRQAHDARNRAAQAEADAARLEGEIAAKKAAADAQVAAVKQKYNSLSQQEQDEMSTGSNVVGNLFGSGAGVKAANAALGKQGSPYVFGAKGPDEFDCSGLVQWSFKQAGVDLPSSTKSQGSQGKEVSRSSIKPGDVVFFYSSASHNGIYIGNGKIVHAPTEGQTVTTEEMDYMGDINTIRRFG